MDKTLPWFQSKAQDNFLYLGDLIPVDAIEDPHNVDLELTINGEVRQKDNTANMIFKIPEILEHISKYITLNEGDIIITGTPENVGPIKEGDLLSATCHYQGALISQITDTIQSEQ